MDIQYSGLSTSEDLEEICNLCNQLGIKLIKSCNNPKCLAKSHSKCLTVQHKLGNTSCKLCKKSIKIKKEFNKIKCLKFYFGIIYTFLMLIGGSIAIVLLSLGKTVNSWVTSGCNVWKEGQNPNPCDNGALFTILCVLPFIFSIWQIPQLYCGSNSYYRYNIFFCLKPYKNTKGRAYVSMAILFLILNSIVILAHVIGYPIIKFIFNKDDFFTWRTSLAGFVVYYIILGTILLIIIITSSVFAIYNRTIEKFSETQVIS